jgi:hypothetical protein
MGPSNTIYAVIRIANLSSILLLNGSTLSLFTITCVNGQCPPPPLKVPHVHMNYTREAT